MWILGMVTYFIKYLTIFVSFLTTQNVLKAFFDYEELEENMTQYTKTAQNPKDTQKNSKFILPLNVMSFASWIQIFWMHVVVKWRIVKCLKDQKASRRNPKFTSLKNVVIFKPLLILEGCSNIWSGCTVLISNYLISHLKYIYRMSKWYANILHRSVSLWKLVYNCQKKTVF